MNLRSGSWRAQVDSVGRRFLTTQLLTGVTDGQAAPSLIYTLTTLLALGLAGWTATFPGGHVLRYPVWIIAATLVAVWWAAAARYILRTRRRAPRVVAATGAGLLTIGLLVVSQTDLVQPRWSVAEDSFHRMALALLIHPEAARAKPGERIAGYAISSVNVDDKHSNVYFEASGTGLGCRNGGFAYLTDFATRAFTDRDDYRQLDGRWYYWVPKPTSCS